MADIKPFCAVRYNSKHFKKPLVSPPYDIITENQRAELASNEHHMINLDKPGREDDEGRYRKAAERFRDWKEHSILVKEEEPSFYVYAQRFKHPETSECFERTGFFTLVKLEKHYENAIFPHEKTLSAPKVDRLNLMKTTQAQFSPVFGLYDDEKNQADAVFQTVKESKPLYDTYHDYDGTEHIMWRVSNQKHTAALNDILKEQKIIIADGHHRYATALNYAHEMRLHNSASLNSMPYDYVLMCLINFNDRGLVILPTHRLLSLNIDTNQLLKRLKEFFVVKTSWPEEIEKALSHKVGNTRMIGLCLGKDKGNYLLALKNEEVLRGIIPESSSQEWRTLEVNLLYYVILKKIINISDEDFETKISYSHSFSETFNTVNNQEIACTFLLPPCTKGDLERVTAAHEVMPQKSTYFFPKIFSGFVLYDMKLNK
ncbi:MAG: DUF1015 domain-containing protein [Candidatus Omnitrophica bacterium]|nr:DUF1015 domain-containing protein [Candidatus Omnitrophota bacterium]